MKTSIHIFSLFLLSVTNHIACAQLTENRTTNPNDAKFVYQDVENFILAYDKLTKESDTVSILQSQYFDKGTKGMKEFEKKYNLNAERLAKALRKYPETYSEIKTKLIIIKALEEGYYKKGFEKLKYYLPSVEFPPTYFLVGSRRGIGSGSIEDPLMTIEKDEIPSLSGDLVGTLVHEMAHMQQLRILGDDYFTIFNEKKTILSLSVREGVAEFLGYLINDGNTYKSQFLPY